MTKLYLKPWLSYSNQLQQLIDRGMIISDTKAAEHFLAHVNYYRFSGYCLAFEEQRHVFTAGTTFEKVHDAYEFDAVLRDLITEALEVIEVDFRTRVAHYFGKTYNAFGHCDSSNFFSTFDHATWRRKVNKEANRSSELFIEHYKKTYLGFPDLPVWIAMELMSFGSVSKMFEGLKLPDQDAMSRQLGLKPKVMATWVHHLVYIRNLCAHHSRLWDRVWTIIPSLPIGKEWQPPYVLASTNLYVTLLILRYWLKRIRCQGKFANSWRLRVEAHLQTPPAAKGSIKRMGLTSGWQQHGAWRS